MEWVGLGIGFLGVLWLNAGSSLCRQSGRLGRLLIAAHCRGPFGSIWSRGRDLPSPFMASAAQMLCGGVAMCIVGALAGERFDGMPSAHGLAAFAYLIVFGSIIGFSAYVWLLHHVRPALAGSYAYVNPAIAVALGAWLAGERFGSHELVAMGGDPARRRRDHLRQGARSRQARMSGGRATNSGRAASERRLDRHRRLVRRGG